jgi:nucleotide-binding universal stress UspA family protein
MARNEGINIVFDRMLVALDGTPGSEAIFPPVCDIARALNAEIHLLGLVPDAADSEASDATYRRLEERSRQLAAEGLRVGTHVRTGAAAEAVLDAINALSADLLAMVDWRGGISWKILPIIHSPMVLVHPGTSSVGKIERLLVPMDESVGAALALGVAAELAREIGAELALIRVVAPFPQSAFDRGPGIELACYVDPAWDSEAVAGAQRHMDGLARQLHEEGLAVTAKTAVGDVPEMILRTAGELDAQMIVMGMHARSGRLRSLLGSVAEAVVQAAKLPVLLVREAAASEAVGNSLALAASSQSERPSAI